MTNFRLSDWEDDTVLNVGLWNPPGFSFESLSQSEHLIGFSSVILISIAEPVLLDSLANCMLEYTFTGRIRSLGGPIGEDMVQYGVSRFKRQVAETDEPLAILALVNFVKEKGLTLQRCFSQSLSTPHAAHRGIVFEAFGAYLLARAFSDPTPLSKVFEFVEGGNKVIEALQGELAQLVTLKKVGDKFETTPVQINDNLWSNHVFGRSPSTVPGTLEWLQNPQDSAFCFPADTVGPDLIFVLRLTSDDTVLRVCVQFKNTEYLSPQDTEQAIRATDPSFFLSRKAKDGNTPLCSNPPMRDEMEEAIKNLGNGTKKAGPCGLLQVLISHPSLPNSNKMDEAAKGSHPLATVSLRHLEPSGSDLGQAIQSLANLALQTSDRKRKSSDDIEGARPKRLKRESRGTT